ncbi:MAG: hypothetical protein PW789_12500 [Edaphobacter sp.]|uniref:DUF6798 domain-containing protein n=1 Tax=Edaphobacter sp. TaxID=1934404 RepID=UPI002391A4CC|nr:DUF6798 domain-containing protein [Edaphobacter sp.]MDE1177404.1 hypothetical protein [Edaphobacter sp.]
MATPVLARPGLTGKFIASQAQERRRYALCLISALTAVALVIHGFHPFAEDGGLYLAGVKRVLDPSLYQVNGDFVMGHLRFSVFAPVVAALVRMSGLGLETVVFLLHLASIWLTLAAAWMLASRCFRSTTERTAAVTLLAVWLTLPIAGTSLMLMDPYVTGRSVSTPMTIFALVGAVDFLRSTRMEGRWNWRALAMACAALAVAAAVHPLMAAYGFGCVLTLAAAATPERRGVRIGAMVGLTASAVAAAMVLRLVAQPESSSYQAVAMSRYYWFLSQWHWYELVGAVAPLMILGAVAWMRRGNRGSAQRELATMGVTAGTIALLIAVLFARVHSTNHLVARMQPMRIFQLIYVVMILFVGAAMSRWMGRRALRWVGVFAMLATIMFVVERKTFPASDRIEIAEDREGPENSWVQAFEWIRTNTPKDAVFALDADYITQSGEDAQGFRAIAERSALPDYSKDGGEAAITPTLSEEWKSGEEAQARLSERTDSERVTMLASKGVGWVVLAHGAQTGFACAYSNAMVKVCRLPEGMDALRVSLRPPAIAAPTQR